MIIFSQEMGETLPTASPQQDAVSHLLKSDPVLAGVMQEVGPCGMSYRPPTFETLARSIAFQQLSGKVATIIFGRVKKATGRRFTAAAFLRLDDEQLRACGLSRQKMASLRDLAQRVNRREISFRKLPAMEDEDIIALLCQVRGIGVWTVQMFLMFALARPDILPLNDLGICNSVRKTYGLEQNPKPAELATIARPWHPYCSVACWYLWRSLDGPADL